MVLGLALAKHDGPIGRAAPDNRRLQVSPLQRQGAVAQGCIRRGGTSEAAPEAVRQAVGGGCQSGWGRLLSVTNAIEASTWHQGDSVWASAGRPGRGGGVTSPPLLMHPWLWPVALPRGSRGRCVRLRVRLHSMSQLKWGAGAEGGFSGVLVFLA